MHKNLIKLSIALGILLVLQTASYAQSENASSNATEARRFHDKPSPEVTFNRLDGSSYRSRDHGQTWTLIKAGAVKDNSSFFATHRPERPIVTEWHGKEYISYDGGSSYWLKPVLKSASGRPSAPATDIEPPAPPLPGVEVLAVVPNPTAGKTTIEYVVNTQEHVRLTINDRLGNEVLLLVNEDKPVGHYTANFNTLKLRDGIYEYRLKTIDQVVTGDVVVVHK